MASTPALEQQELYGGALTVHIPEGWLDTEEFMEMVQRPVPDNQEIFVAPASADGKEASKPLSLFIDVLESADGDCPDMAEAPRFHGIEILKRDERAAEAESLSRAAAFPVELPPAVIAGGGDGIDTKAAVFEEAMLEVCVVRIPAHETDLVFSLHGRVGNSNESEASCPPLAALVATLSVENWGLFGGGDEGEGEGEEMPRYLGS